MARHREATLPVRPHFRTHHAGARREVAMARRRTAPLLTILLLLLVSTAARPCVAQPSNNTTIAPHHSRAAVGGFTPTTVIVLVALVSAFVVLTLFSIYINRCAPTRAPPPRRSQSTYPPPDHHHHHAVAAGGAVVHPERRARAGLDREVVESFPTAVYGDVKARVATAKSSSGPPPPLECAVCLAAFDDRDELRVLPACCHVFHPDCIDPWLAAAVTCPLCRADLTVLNAPYPPPAGSSSSEGCDCDLTAARQGAMVREQPGEEAENDDDDDDDGSEARLVAAFTPESVISFGAARPHEFHYRRTQSAMDVPDRHTLRLPEHVMKELAAVRRHRRAASLAGYPDDGGAERTPPGWLASFWRSVSWQRPSRTDQDAVVDEHGGGNSKRVVPIVGTPAESPGGSGDATGDKEKPDHDALNQV